MRLPSLHRPRPVPSRPESGFSIVELIVSLTLFGLVVGSLVTLIASGLSVARTNKDRSVAAHLASQEMDAIREKSFNALTLGQAVHRVTVNSVSYRVTDDLEWAANTATSSACDSTGTSPRVLRVTVTVTWPNMRDVEPVRTSTEISPPVGSYDPDNGHIAVRVRDRDGQPIGSVPVRVVGGGTDRTQTTLDETGCAFFGFLVPATYSVTLGTPGWVDRQSLATPSRSVGVTASNVSSVAFDYDEAASISATLTPNQGGTPVNDVPLSIANTALLPAGTRAYPGVGIARSLTSLFPFADGFEVWAGACADADPEGTDPDGNRYWDGARRDDAVSVEPGGRTDATVTLQTVAVRFTAESDLGSVTLVAVHEPDAQCASGETLTLGTVSGTDGDLLVGMPYGQWSFRAAGRSASSAWDTLTLDPNDPDPQTVTVAVR